MRAFYHPDQALHRPLQAMRRGRVVPAHDVPARTEALIKGLADRGIEVEEPPEAGWEPAVQVHTAEYLRFLDEAWPDWQALGDAGPEVWPGYFPYWSGERSHNARPSCLARSILGRAGWFLGDLSAPLTSGTAVAVRRSCASAVAAARAVIDGEVVSYALCRPPGHHARTDRAAGACFVNNAAVAAECLRSRFARVAILDIDVHHGDGTEQVFYARPDVLTVSIHADPREAYPYFTGGPDDVGFGEGKGFNFNLPLSVGSGWPDYGPALDRALARIVAFGADAVVLSAGFDAYRRDPVGLMELEVQDFGRVGARLAALALPMVIVQERGYEIGAIGECLAALLAGLGAGPEGRSGPKVTA